MYRIPREQIKLNLRQTKTKLTTLLNVLLKAEIFVDVPYKHENSE